MCSEAVWVGYGRFAHRKCYSSEEDHKVHKASHPDDEDAVILWFGDVGSTKISVVGHDA